MPVDKVLEDLGKIPAKKAKKIDKTFLGTYYLPYTHFVNFIFRKCLIKFSKGLPVGTGTYALSFKGLTLDVLFHV